MKKFIQFAVSGAIALLILFIVGKPIVMWMSKKLISSDIGTSPSWETVASVFQSDGFILFMALLALVAIMLLFKSNSIGKMSALFLGVLAALFVYVGLVPERLSDWQSSSDKREFGTEDAEKTRDILQDLHAQIAITEAANELAKAKVKLVPRHVQVVPVIPSEEVLVHNFVIPANSKVAVPRQGMSCKTDSTRSKLITWQMRPGEIVYTSRESEDVLARIWLYDQSKSSSCRARYALLHAQGKIF